MKKLIYPILLLFLVISNSGHAQQRSFKRGISYQIPYADDVKEMSKGVSWFYNWGDGPSNAVSNALEEYEMDFLPMAWNGNYNETAIRNYLKNHPNIKYLLGFNEPNFKAQANMTPIQAAAEWKKLEKIADDLGLELVGPAVNYSPDAPYQDPIKWLDEFFDACPDCRVDHIAVHCYMPYPSALMWYIGRFKKYEKPIWLTEFCAWDNFWEIPGDAATNQLSFMVNAINYLEHDPDVYRYAWFIPRTGENDKWPFMQLLEDNKPGVLTKLGKVFVNMSSQDKSHYFETGAQIPAEHYTSMNIADVPNSDEWKSSILLEPTNDESGILNIWDFKEDRWVEYNVDITTSGFYNLNLRVASQASAICKVYIDKEEITSLNLTSTNGFDNWETQGTQINIPAGKHTLRLKVTSGDIKLNWLMLSSEASGINNGKNKDLYLYPNPVSDILNVRTDDIPWAIQIYNMQGQQLGKAMNTNFIDMGFLSDGIYLVKVLFTEELASTFSVVKR